VTKLTCEKYLAVFASLYGLETVSLRYFNVFGPNQLPEGPYAAAIPRFVHAALTGTPITVFGDGEQTRDFCFVDNAVSANLVAADSPRKLNGEVVNVAGGRRLSLNELIVESGRVLGRPLDVRYVDPRPGDVRHSLADISRARTYLGYEPTRDFRSGLRASLPWYERRFAADLAPGLRKGSRVHGAA